MSADSTIIARFDACYPGFSLQADLVLPGRGVTVLFGHSGSGKTTLLRAIAGLERHPGGYLEVAGALWQDDARALFVPTHQRALGYVFQEASLFAHLSVRANLEFGWRRVAPAKRQVDMQQAIDLLGIGKLMERRPGHLSGGEKQRVAIARALVAAPKLLLMDEPLAGLDLQRKQEILPYLERLHQELAIPLIYVTHSPDEMARLADHLVVLDNGKVSASGSLFDTLARLDLPTAFAQDAGVVVQASVSALDPHYHLMHLSFAGAAIVSAHQGQSIGQRVRFRILARDVSVTLAPQQESSILNQLPARVLGVAAADTPAHVLLGLDVGGTTLLARITRRSRDELGIAEGKSVWAQLKAVAVLSSY
jgi:molybdate transport system ATP-binding protein